MVTTSSLANLASTITFDSLNNTYVVGVGTATADIQALVDAVPSGTTVCFAAGTHTLTETLKVTHDGVTLAGDPQGGTKLVIANNVTGDGIVFVGGGVDTTYTGHLAADVARGSNTITVENVAGLKVGDVLRVSQSNDLEFLKANYPNIIGDAALANNPLRESVSEIVAIEGNTITFKYPVAYTMSAGTCTTVERLDMLENVGLKDLTITYNLGVPNDASFVNAKKAFVGSDAVVMNYTQAAQVSNVTFLNVASTALEMRNALEANVSNLTVDGAHNKDDGNGYGLHMASSFYSTYVGLTITDVRHSVVFSSWNAEIGNTLQVDYTNRDINYHGSDDYGNTVIVEKAIYADGKNSWSLVSDGGISHAATNMDANTTLFGYAVGGKKADTIHARDGGASLFGMAGDDVLYGGNGDDTINGGANNDILIGGAGNDVMIGGIGIDTMTGGDGVDTFIVNKGEATRDVITDFKTGVDGDVLQLAGYTTLKTFADLKLSQVGADVKLVLSTTESILFKNHVVSDFAGSNIFAGGVKLESAQVAQVLQVVQSVAAVDVSNVDKVFTMTSKADTFVGGSGDDTVISNLSAIRKGDVLNLGQGEDTLKIISAKGNIDLTGVTVKGLDVIDLTGTTAIKKLVITADAASNADNGHLVVAYSDKSLTGLDTSHVDATHDVILKGGSGTIALASGVNNHVVLDNAASVSLTGGNGNDVILSKGVAAWIDGGAGDDLILGGVGGDTLTGGLGHDVFAYTNTSQFGDTIRDFSTVITSSDALDLSTLFDANGLGDMTLVDALSTGHLQLTQQGTATAVVFDVDGFADAHAAATIATLDNTLVQNIAANQIIL